MKQIILFLLIFARLTAENLDNNSTVVDDTLIVEVLEKIEDVKLHENDVPIEPVVVDDTSGLSDDEVRDIAKKEDDKKMKKVSVDEVIEAIDKDGKVDISKIQSSWENMTPSANKSDWIQTKHGEWLRGEIIALYDEKIEFDSKEFGEYIFDMDDINQIKSFHMISVNIEDVAEFTGIIRLKDEEIKIIQGDKEFVFPVSQIVSLAQDGELERHNWKGKISLSFDSRAGNKTQYDFVAHANIKRRTSRSRFIITYLGRISDRHGEETADDHRVNQSYNIYLTRRFFWTPLFSEYYKDEFQNIDNQYTAGFGLGYTPIKKDWVEWDISTGPAIIYTEFSDVTPQEDKYPVSPALELSTHLDVEIFSFMDMVYDNKLIYTDCKSGRYKHHMVLSLETEVSSWLDFDVSGIWDYIARPEERSNHTSPEKSDFQLLIGLGVEF